MHTPLPPTPEQSAILAQYTRAQLLAVMVRTPELAIYGFWSEADYPIDQRAAHYQEERAALAAAVPMFQYCCLWLANCQPTKGTSRTLGTSYGLKHKVENLFQFYVTNGAFIAAALHLGITVRRVRSGPNGYVGIAKRSLPTSAAEVWATATIGAPPPSADV